MCLYVVKSFGIKDNSINTIFKEAKIMKKLFCITYPNTYIYGRACSTTLRLLPIRPEARCRNRGDTKQYWRPEGRLEYFFSAG